MNCKEPLGLMAMGALGLCALAMLVLIVNMTLATIKDWRNG